MGEVQLYLWHSDYIPPMPRKVGYQEPYSAIAMQVVETLAPRGTEKFIATELS